MVGDMITDCPSTKISEVNLSNGKVLPPRIAPQEKNKQVVKIDKPKELATDVFSFRNIDGWSYTCGL